MVAIQLDSDIEGARKAESSPLHWPVLKPQTNAPALAGGRRTSPEDTRAILGQLEDGKATRASGPGSAPSITKPSKPHSFRDRLGGIVNALTSPSRRLNKWLLAGSIPAFGLLIAAVGILFFIGSLLKIPNLAADITEYEFASLTRQVSDAADRALEESLADGTADTALYEQLVEKYKGLRDGLDNKILKQLSPEAAIRVLGKNNGLDFVYKPKAEMSLTDIALGRNVLKSVVLDGKPYDIVPQRGFIRSFWPKFLDIPYIKAQIKFASDFAPALSSALRTNDVNVVMRSWVANRLRQELGINLVAWHVGDYVGKKTAAASATIDQEAYAAVGNNGESVAPSSTPDIQKAEQEVLNDTNAVVHDAATNPAELQQTIASGGIPEQGIKDVESVVGESTLKDVVSFINPVYAIALPACIVYEGSLDSAGPSINQAVAAQQKAFYFVASGADQEKAGTSSSWSEQDAAIGALNAKLGDITDSNAFLRANGQTVDTLATNKSAEAGALDDFTLIDATPLIGSTTVGDTIKKIANAACPYFANLAFGLTTGVILTIATVALDIPTGGAPTEGEIAAEEASNALLEQASKNFATRWFESFLGEKASTKAVAGKLRELFVGGLKDAARLTFLTVAAKMIVMWKAGQLSNGLEHGAEFANEADAGANNQANELMRRQVFGRPLTCAELSQTSRANKQYIAEQNAQKGFVTRYLALGNPDSLLTRTAVLTYSQLGDFLIKPVGNIFNILSGPLSFGTILNNVSGIGYATIPCSHQYYGNVQFGWSEDEEKLLDSSYSYLPLENQRILDQSGKENDIAQKYAACFGYSFNDSGKSMDPTSSDSMLQLDVEGDGSIGELLSSGNITRDTNGDIVTDQDYLCSPQNLGPNNPTYNDLVFRWRLAMSYDTSINQLTNLQSVGN